MRKVVGVVLVSMFMILGCSSDNGGDNDGGDVPVYPVTDVAKNIVGKWKLQSVLFGDGTEFKEVVGFGVVESRDYSRKGKVFINYKLFVDKGWKEMVSNNSFDVSGSVITYIDSKTNKAITEKVVKLTKNELVVSTDITNEVLLLNIYNPEDPLFIEGSGFKVFTRQ